MIAERIRDKVTMARRSYALTPASTCRGKRAAQHCDAMQPIFTSPQGSIEFDGDEKPWVDQSEQFTQLRH